MNLKCPNCGSKDLRASVSKNLQYCRKCGYNWKLNVKKEDYVKNISSIRELYELTGIK